MTQYKICHIQATKKFLLVQGNYKAKFRVFYRSKIRFLKECEYYVKSMNIKDIQLI